MKAADYAQRLLEVMRSLPIGASHRSSAIAMAQPSEVEGRVKDVLIKKRDRRPTSPRKLAAGLMFVGAGVSALASLHLLANAQAADTSAPSPAKSVYGTDTIPSSSRSKLPNGYEVSLVAVTQAVRDGNEWDMYRGPWWRSDGKPTLPQSGGMNGHLHWSVARTHGLAPYVFKIAVRPPHSHWQANAGDNMTFFCQFLGALKAPEYVVEARPVTSIISPIPMDTASPLIDDSAPYTFDGQINSTLPAELYPTGTHTCTVRCGAAMGPWRAAVARSSSAAASNTTASHASPFTTVLLSFQGTPKVTCRDAQGRTRVFSFEKSLGHLSDVGWRLGAVDRAGRAVPMFHMFALSPGASVVRSFNERSVIGTFDNGKAQGIVLEPRDPPSTFTWNTSVNLTHINAFRLETRPYQMVEFHNVQLSPAADASGFTPSFQMLVEQARGVQFDQARALRTHLQPWAKSNKNLLVKMAHSHPSDLSALMAVYESLQRLPYPLWSGDPRLSRGDDDPPFSFGLPSRLTLPHLQRSHDSVETQMRRDFGQYRDFRVTESEAEGGQQITLWASGRITQNTISKTTPRGNQQEMVLAFYGENGTSDMAEGASSIVASDPFHTPQEQSIKPAYGFRRYMSPPLPDGTRFTFLYPSYYNQTSQQHYKAGNEYWAALLSGSGAHPVPWAAVRGQTAVAYYLHGKNGTSWLAPHEEFCSIVVGNAGEVAFPAGSSVLRKDTRWIGPNGSHHTFSITDRRTHLRFLLTHEDRYIPALFNQTDPVIASSFRILPPTRTDHSEDKWTELKNRPIQSSAATEVAPAVPNAAHAETDTAAAHIALGQKLQQNGQPRDGIPEFRRAVQIEPNNAEAQYQLAQALYEINWKRVGNSTDTRDTPPAALDEAILHMRRAVALQPNNADWQSMLGNYLDNRGRYAEAIPCFRNALHLLGPTPIMNVLHRTVADGSGKAGEVYDNHYSLADALLKAGQFHEAIVHYQEALRFNPQAEYVLLGYGNALNAVGRKAEARAAWKKVIHVVGSKNYYGHLAQAQLSGRPQQP